MPKFIKNCTNISLVKIYVCLYNEYNNFFDGLSVVKKEMHKMNKEIRLGMIGLGGRGRSLIKQAVQQ